jgi:hypothetical protein
MDVFSQNLKSLPGSGAALRNLLRLVTKPLHCLDFAHGIRFGYVSLYFMSMVADIYIREEQGTCFLMIKKGMQNCKLLSLSIAVVIYLKSSMADKRGGNTALFRVVYRDGKLSSQLIMQVTINIPCLGILYYVCLASTSSLCYHHL